MGPCIAGHRISDRHGLVPLANAARRTRYRIYAFRYGSNAQIYQGAWNPGANAYQFCFASIDVLDLVGFPSTSDVGPPAMLHDGGSYRFYFQTL